jgi:hypothetical protein
MLIHGTRVEDNSLKNDPFRPGAYGRVCGIQVPGKWHWMGVTPNGLHANLSAHDVTEHEDGTITVSPSILVTLPQGDAPTREWHGYLERGVWRQC